jgi:hypothetical protein
MLKSLATIFLEVDATTKQDQPTIPVTQKDGDVSTQPKARATRNRIHPMNSFINGVNHVQSIKPSSIMQKRSKLPLVKVHPSFTSQPPLNVQSSNVSTLPTNLQKLEPIGVSNVDSLDVVETVEENEPLFSYLNGLMDENLEEVIDNDPQMMARELGVLTCDYPPQSSSIFLMFIILLGVYNETNKWIVNKWMTTLSMVLQQIPRFDNK